MVDNLLGLAVGIAIGTIVIAMYLPMFSLISQIG